MEASELQGSKTRFSEFVDAAIEKGPQVVTRDGEEVAVLVSIGEWRRLQPARHGDIKEILLNGPKFDFQLPRHKRRRRS